MKRFGVLLSILIVIAAGFTVLMYRQHWQPSREPIRIVIATLETPHSGLVQIAAAKGFFDQEGLSATVRTTKTGHEGIDQVLKGEADFGGTAETPIAKALAEGKRFKVISTIFNSSKYIGIVARKDRGIRATEDLKGKRIGFILGTASHFMLETFLAFHRVPADSVTLVPLKPDVIVSALTSGRVDAAATWNPYLAAMRQELGDNATAFFPEEFYAETFNLIIRSDYLIENRPATARLIRALLRTETFVQDHPEEALRIISESSGTEPGFLKDSGDPITFQVTLNQSLLLATEREADWFFRRGLVPKAPFPDVLDAMEPEPLRSIKPSAVSIVKGS